MFWATTDDGVLAASIYDTVPTYFLSTGYADVECFYKNCGDFLCPLPKIKMQQDINTGMRGVDVADFGANCY